MSKRLYIGNLSYNTSQDKIVELFGASSVVMPKDASDRPKGFAFADIEDDEKVDALIKQYDGFELDGRALTVSIARPREDRSQNRGGYPRYDR